MKFQVSEDISLADAFKVFKSTYKEGEFLAPSQVPLIIRLLENPSFSFKIFGMDLFPGRVSLLRHDYLHALMGMQGNVYGEAFVIGTTMGSTGKMNKFKSILFVTLENLLAPANYHYDTVTAKKIFHKAVEESTQLARQGILKDLSKFDIENHPNESVGVVRKKLGLDVLMKNL